MNCLQYFQRGRFSKVCIKFAMFKLSLAIISPIMLVAPPFEPTRITHTQGHITKKIWFLRDNFMANTGAPIPRRHNPGT